MRTRPVGRSGYDRIGRRTHFLGKAWQGIKFAGKAETMPDEAYLMDHSEGARLMKNMVTTKVYYVESGARPLKITSVPAFASSGTFCSSGHGVSSSVSVTSLPLLPR